MAGDPSDKLLDYGDVLLRRGDYDLFGGSHWLNDQCTAFFFEYLAREAHPENTQVLLIPGATAYLLSTAGELCRQRSSPPLLPPPQLLMANATHMQVQK